MGLKSQTSDGTSNSEPSLTNSFTNENIQLIDELFVEGLVLIRRDEAVKAFAFDWVGTGNDGSLRNA